MLSKSAFVLLLLLLTGWAALSGAATADRPFLAKTVAAPPQALQLAASAFVFVNGPAPPAALGGLPSSVLPHTDSICSVEDDGTTVRRCSVLPTGRCSMQCNQSGNCSAIATPSPAQNVFCSTHDGNLQRRCSVLPPDSGQGGTPFCSSLFFANMGTGTATCSVFATTGACSVENIPGLNASGQCSTGPDQCSVLNFGSSVRGFCSVGKLGGKMCSTFALFINNDHCTILQGTFGACTVFKGAPIGACSAHGLSTNCSVENGPGPNANGVCRLP